MFLNYNFSPLLDQTQTTLKEAESSFVVFINPSVYLACATVLELGHGGQQSEQRHSDHPGSGHLVLHIRWDLETFPDT